MGDAYPVGIRRKSKLTVSPTCHMEQTIDIVQLNGRNILEDRDPNVLESAAELFGLALSKFAQLCVVVHGYRLLSSTSHEISP